MNDIFKTIKKSVQRKRTRLKEVEEAKKRRVPLPTFAQFLKRKQFFVSTKPVSSPSAKVVEEIDRTEFGDPIYMYIPAGAKDRKVAIEELASSLLALTAKTDVVLVGTAILNVD